jgi:rRNA-processing protein FCF1
VQKNHGIIATIDSELKRRIKENGGSILSVANDRIILEPSKI